MRFDETARGVYRVLASQADVGQTMATSIAQLIDTQKVLLCVGAGGVGKTTLSAALGVAAAKRGKRTLVLTVDPARRLANALGLQTLGEHVQTIDMATFAAQGCQVQVPLDAAMLDVKHTFDRVVQRYAKSPESARRILEHPFYQQASTALAGSQEYMATERLYECVTSGLYDLVVLDTPPAEHALDFLDAPRRLIDLFDSQAFRRLIAPSTRLKSGLFKPSSMVMKGLSRFTSAEMFGNLLEFFGHLAETFDGFVERARDVQALLKGPDAAFVLVSACDEVSTEQARFLLEHLRAQEMKSSAWLVNRVLGCDPALASASDDLETKLLASLRAVGPDAMGGDERDGLTTAKHLASLSRRLGKWAAHDAALLEAVRHRAGSDLQVVALPRRHDEPDSLRELNALADLLLADQGSP